CTTIPHVSTAAPTIGHIIGTIRSTHGPFHHITTASTAPHTARATKSERNSGRSCKSTASTQNPGARNGTNHRTEQHPPPMLFESTAYTAQVAAHHPSRASSSARPANDRRKITHPAVAARSSGRLWFKNPCLPKSIAPA